MSKKRELPPLPKRLPSSLGWIKVRRVKKLRSDDGEACHGIFHWDRRLIEVAANLEGAAAWATLFHEYVHAGLSDGGMDANLNHGATEAVADIVATLFTSLLVQGILTPEQKVKRTSVIVSA